MSTRQIVVAGLSPAWQQILVLDEFHPGEVNRAREVHWCASGKVLNVAIALAGLSNHNERTVNSRVLSVIGPRARQAIEPELAALGVRRRWIETQSETRICTTILDRGGGLTTELVENSPPLLPDEIARFRQAFAEEAANADVVVLTGSLPPVAQPQHVSDSLHVGESLRDSPVRLGEPQPREETRPNEPANANAITLYRELLQATPARAILDVRGPELLAALECQPFCLKPNREELGQTLGRALNSDSDLHAAMRDLNEQGAQWVIVTQGAGPVWMSGEGKLYIVEPPRVERVVNPIGSGDCLAAGIAWSIARGCDMPEAVRFGITAAADNVGQLLPARLNRQRVAELQSLVTVRCL